MQYWNGAQKKQIIISGDRAPSDLDGVEERLRSRLSFGVVGEIQKSDYALRLSIIKAKSKENSHISSSLVKDIIKNKGDIKKFLPNEIAISISKGF